MSPERHLSEEETTNRMFLSSANLAVVAQGGSRRPVGEMGTHLLNLIRLGEELENDDDYLGDLHAAMIADLDTVEAGLSAGAYGKKVTRNLEKMVRDTKRTLGGMIEMAPEVEAAIARRWESRLEEWKSCMQSWVTLPEGDERDDLFLSPFICFTCWDSEMFEKKWDVEIYRDMFESAHVLEPWDTVFESPKDIARALYRRGWMTEEQADELFLEWD